LELVTLKIIEGNLQSQCRQDEWVLEETNKKRNGYFVEFGATDGKTISNTYGLEKDYGWTGIVAEANPIYKDALIANRSCAIYTGAVYSHDDGVKFNMAVASDLSTISGYGTDDEHAINRLSGNLINVETCTLRQLLERNDAPTNIDYISIDTEGSEYDILECFFDDPQSDKYNVQLFTVEHNFTPAREKIKGLMEEQGYERVRTDISRFDDFYRKKI